MQVNFDTDKITIIFYPLYAGGKFLMNCLALSKYATFQHNEIALNDILNKDLHNKNLYDLKLAVALKTLPTDKNEIKNWLNYDFKCNKFLGWCAAKNYTSLTNNTATQSLKILSNRNDIDFFIAAHDTEQVKRVLFYFKNAKIIFVKDCHKFKFIAEKLKTFNLENVNYDEEKEINNDKKWIEHFYKTNYKKYYTISYKHIFDEEKFIPEIKNLYEKLGYDDFNLDLITKYYRAYINLHT